MDDPVQGDQLRSLIERIERLEEEKKTISDDIKEVYAEAKGSGYDVKVMRKVVALRKQDANERAEFEAILNLYMQAVGDLADTPLGRAAAPGFSSSRAAMARSASSHSERVSCPAETARRAHPEPGTRIEGQPGARTPESEHVDRGASAQPLSAIGRPAISSTAGDAGTGQAAFGKAAEAAALEQPSEAGIGSAVRPGAPESPEPDATPAGAVVADRSGATAGETAADGREASPSLEQRSSAPFLSKPYDLRPNCRSPERCGGYGSHHCFRCRDPLPPAGFGIAASAATSSSLGAQV